MEHLLSLASHTASDNNNNNNIRVESNEMNRIQSCLYESHKETPYK